MKTLSLSLCAISLAYLAFGCQDSATVNDNDATETGGVGQVDAAGNTAMGGVDTTAGGGTAATTGATGGTVSGTGGSGTANGGSGIATGGSGITTGGSGITTGGSGIANGGSGTATGGSGIATGGSGTETGGVATGGSGTETGGSGTETGGSGTETGGIANGGSGTETGGDPGTGGSGTETGGSAAADCDTEPLVLDNPAAAADFTEDLGGASIDMVYIPGGTFTLGCESGDCPPDTTPVEGVTLSSYHIAKTQVTAAMWEAVMGEPPEGFGLMINWYDAMALACKLSHQTGRAYRMMTEAEFEYAVKSHPDSLEDIGSGEEWAYNSWSTSHSTVLNDPVGSASGKHTQKTRRDVDGSSDRTIGRLIRSIDGIGPQLRLVISNGVDFPPEYVPPCELCPPVMGPEPENSFRDPRWITGSDTHWVAGAELGFGTMDLRVWEDGTAKQGNTEGQWFTSNNIVFVFVPNSGDIQTYPYIFLDDTQGSLLSAGGFSGFIGRIAKESAESVEKPTISDLQTGAALAAAAGDNYKMVDMVNMPESARGQDDRLLDGTDQCWFQDNSGVGGIHHYRKDVDLDEFRFTVNQGNQTMLANGAWFTINNTFLRVTHSGGYVTDYLYVISSDGSTFYHNSYQKYERADFRMFELKSNSESFPASCGSHCSSEIPKGEDASMYSNWKVGQSTFRPAPCPAGGCP